MFFDRRSGGDGGRDRNRDRGHDHDHDHDQGQSRGGGRGGPAVAEEGYRPLVEEPGSHLLFIGSYSCVRHKGTERLQLQKEGKISFLCLQEIDWITGDYLGQIEEAAQEVAQRHSVQKLILFGGCQLELLSVDFNLLTQQLTDQLGIPVIFHKGCHLVGYLLEGEDA